MCGRQIFSVVVLVVVVVGLAIPAHAQQQHVSLAAAAFPFENQTIFVSDDDNRNNTFTAELTFFRDVSDVWVGAEVDGKSVFAMEEGQRQSFRAYRPFGVSISLPSSSSATEATVPHELVWVLDIQSAQEPQTTLMLRLEPRKFWLMRKPTAFPPSRAKHHVHPELLLPTTMKRRSELGLLLNAHGLVGKGAEVGVKQGEFSEVILSHWKGELLYLVDPWAYQGDAYVDVYGNQQQQIQDMFMEQTRMRLQRFGDRFELWREFSVVASADVDDLSLDFVYLDAMHEYAPVKEDLWAWWRKVKVGGLFCGHDYKDGLLEHGNFGVISAVDEFAAHVGHEAMWTMGSSYNWFPSDPIDASPSWYFFKKHEGVQTK